MKWDVQLLSFPMKLHLNLRELYLKSLPSRQTQIGVKLLPFLKIEDFDASRENKAEEQH